MSRFRFRPQLRLEMTANVNRRIANPLEAATAPRALHLGRPRAWRCWSSGLPQAHLRRVQRTVGCSARRRTYLRGSVSAKGVQAEASKQLFHGSKGMTKLSDTPDVCEEHLSAVEQRLTDVQKALLAVH
jgi:hypothetical protein